MLSTDETFTLAFLSTAYSDVIPTSTNVTYPKVCNQKATHVVNKIVYGQNAYFFFKHSKQSSNEKQDVGGNLQAVVESIPAFAIKGPASVKLTGEQKKLADSTKVRFNGDFILKNGIPTTFDGAITAFKELSSNFLLLYIFNINLFIFHTSQLIIFITSKKSRQIAISYNIILQIVPININNFIYASVLEDHLILRIIESYKKKRF